ncbi:hypothetical protein BT96DRAFT_264706 [Gymnopus androsaceus JB14]|uniref:Uncharacterized protein n=1 Tax=Gymnopus androsaceus JB14 TaxID=1447944 RepID=A0A6A4H4C7_9AGAR|nr:hypothetical protein BT96DRAFT_264706 [Gymnopus androsaceus JB14]
MSTLFNWRRNFISTQTLALALPLRSTKTRNITLLSSLCPTLKWITTFLIYDITIQLLVYKESLELMIFVLRFLHYQNGVY